MSKARKVHNSDIQSLDLQIVELVNTVTGKSGKNIVLTDLDTGLRYALTATIVAGEPVTKLTAIG